VAANPQFPGQRPPTTSQRKIAFAALRHRDYRRYFFVIMLSHMGDNIEHVISYWLLFQKFHSPVLGGFAVISHWTPFLFFAVYFGSLADRLDAAGCCKPPNCCSPGSRSCGRFYF
jgi:hypothetical protein